MWRLLFALVLLINVAGFTPVYAAPDLPPGRMAECDQCGYCPLKGFLPSNWNSCRRCLYPDANPTPESGDTLRINPEDNNGPTPKSGHYYTMVGCLQTNLDDFTSAGAAGGVVQSLLDLLFKVAGGIAFLYLMYGSFLLITSQGNSEKLNHGRRVITGAIIGLVFSLASLLIVNVIAGVLKIPGFGNP